MTSTTERSRALVRELREKAIAVKAARGGTELPVVRSRSGQYLIIGPRSGVSRGVDAASTRDDSDSPSSSEVA
ncbi:hypothetical protein MT356_18910 [Rathayibacter festucae]|uniref:hypothetical protein n=1 Tax=Rathayibacter festucae TaxID=110937 RepID=UPI001FB241C6|nr:hypothetical protein [Rathayibacter festucae]MCJ1701783.1 hypothetical protein [Rathayibacter festucae]